MLKTNSKQAQENVKAYIVNHFDSSGYTDEQPEGFPAIAAYILKTFNDEKRYYQGVLPEQELFIDWAQGLPSLLDTYYYYNRSAVDDLGAILEETEAEKSRYTDEQAAEVLTRLMYREIVRAVEKAKG
jgi:hypothetical protein